jgi:hypothetical protein
MNHGDVDMDGKGWFQVGSNPRHSIAIYRHGRVS